MRSPHDRGHRRGLTVRHLALIAVLAVLGSAGTFAVVTASASANWRAPAPPPSGPSTDPRPTPEPGGPTPADYADIRSAGPAASRIRTKRGGSSGTFTARCGRNANRHHNPDNFIVAPGVSNGAHHVHDYVGNLSTDAFSDNRSLRAAGTTCAQSDKSTYFWPVLRLRSARDLPDADGNTGTILRPAAVSLQFRGSPTARVVAMPTTLRVITGDAKALTNGTANARAVWSCSGFTDRALTDEYPLCPGRSKVLRILDFPSCWDGDSTDSADHRSHIVFPGRDGRCARGLKAVPQLRMTLAYDVPAKPLAFALDTFPEQLHKPATDHADFANFMPERLMRQAVRCINTGRRC